MASRKRSYGDKEPELEPEAPPADVFWADAPRFERVYWTREPHLRKLYGMAVILMVASATTGYDGMLVNTSQQITAWEYFFADVADDPNKLGILVNMFSIGSIVSFFITPFVADHYGRKTAIIIGCFFMIVGGCLTAFATSWGLYMGGRFSLGFGNSLAQMSSPLLLTEICHPQHRGPVTAIYNCLWNAGALLSACIGWGIGNIQSDWSWRILALMQIVPSVIQICGIWFIPESPRFLVNKDRHEEALNVLAKWHAGGNRHNATVQFEYREIKETIRIEKEADRATSYLDFFRTKGNRWRLAIIVSLGIISQYSGNAMFSNYMNAVYDNSGITNQNQKLALSTGNTILNLIVTMTAALNVDKFGRRPLFLVSTFGMVISCACWTVTGAIFEQSGGGTGVGVGNFYAGYAQIAFIWVFGIFYDIGFSGLLVAYALEVLPFHLRAKGMMLMNIVVQAILALSNQTNLLAWEHLPRPWYFMLFYTIWDCVELVFVWFFYVETKGPTLEEIARIFDGNDAVPHIDLYEVEKEMSATTGGWDDQGSYAAPVSPTYERPRRVQSPSYDRPQRQGSQSPIYDRPERVVSPSHDRVYDSPRPGSQRNFSTPQAYPRDNDTPRFERNPVTGRFERVHYDI